MMASEMGFTNLPDELLIQIFSYLAVEDIVLSVQHVNQRWREVVNDGVKWVYLVYEPYTSENDIVAFLEQAPKLEVFFLHAAVTFNILQAVIQHCKFIKVLKLDVHKLLDRQVKQLVTGCTRITHLHLIDYSAEFYTRNCLNHISKCPELIFLRLQGRISSGQHGVFNSIANGCRSLKYLDIKELNGFSTSEDLQYLIDQKKDQIVSLYFSRTLPCLESCTKLKYLYIGCSEVVTNITDLNVFRLPTLMSLTLVNCALSNEINVDDFLFSNELKELFLSGSSGIKIFLTKALLKNINCLALQDCDEVTDDALKVVPSDLALLDIRGSRNLSDEGIAYLSKCHNIKYLDISCCGCLTFRTMNVVLNLESLEELKVDSTFIVSVIDNKMPTRVNILKYVTAVIRCYKESKVDLKVLRNCIPSIRQLNYEYDNANDRSDYYGLHDDDSSDYSIHDNGDECDIVSVNSDDDD